MEPQAIKEWRKTHGVRTQAALAGYLDVSRESVARWETGVNKPPGNMLERSLRDIERDFAKARTFKRILG